MLSLLNHPNPMLPHIPSSYFFPFLHLQNIILSSEHSELPPQSYVTTDELELKLGKWLKNQKERFKEQRVALSENQHNRMLNIKVFKDWTDSLSSGTDKRKERYKNVRQTTVINAVLFLVDLSHLHSLIPMTKRDTKM